MSDLYFARLDVYRAASRFAVLSDDLARRFPRGQAHLRDQLLRASSSVVFNVAEGAGETSGKEKARFYRMARRSATESAAIIDLAATLSVAEPAIAREAREVAIRVVQMLTRLIKRFEPWEPEIGDRARVPEPEPEPFTDTGHGDE